VNQPLVTPDSPKTLEIVNTFNRIANKEAPRAAEIKIAGQMIVAPEFTSLLTPLVIGNAYHQILSQILKNG
jgi:hypothetical protein